MALCAVRDLGEKGYYGATEHSSDRIGRAPKQRCGVEGIRGIGRYGKTFCRSGNQCKDIPTIVSLMHANNEIGTKIDLHEFGSLCRKYDAFSTGYGGNHGAIHV